jgi:hypothetical protein
MQCVVQLKELARAEQFNVQVTLTTFATQNQKQMQCAIQIKELARAEQSNVQVALTTFATQNQKQKAQPRKAWRTHHQILCPT